MIRTEKYRLGGGKTKTKWIGPCSGCDNLQAEIAVRRPGVALCTECVGRINALILERSAADREIEAIGTTRTPEERREYQRQWQRDNAAKRRAQRLAAKAAAGY